MGKKTRKKDIWFNTKRQMTLVIGALTLLVALSLSAFITFYRRYNEELLYAERLSQMQEVTEQLFSGLEDIVTVQWNQARVQCNTLKAAKPETVEEMVSLMAAQVAINEIEDGSEIIAVDAQGRYYTQDGEQGLMADMRYLEGSPERVSYVFNEMTTTDTRMVFLCRLEEPLSLVDGSRTVEITYYGLAPEMDLLDPYFACEAYDGNNSTYVVDTQGLKLFSGSGHGELIQGFNVFSVLRGMDYLHDSSFDDTLQTMEETGLAYSNAVLDGVEYYYALYRMENAQWILLFLVPSDCVATNTVRLVTTTSRLLLIFGVFMSVACAMLLYVVLRIQQRRALRFAEETNSILEANNEEMKEAQAATNRALKAAEAASRAKTEFLSNMSHDIRTPMNAIVGITGLMAHDKNDPVKIESYIEKVQQSSQHLLSLVNDVLDMSKIESGEVMLSMEPVSIAEQISQVENILRPQFEERKQKFEIYAHNVTHEHLIGDAVRLRQVFINLLSNAMKYTPDGGTVVFSLEELPCDVADHAVFRICVTDSGCGMTPEFLKHIFEPFTRAENSTTNRVQGTGLGMAITKNIVDLAGGSISVESEVGKGSRFTVELPFWVDNREKTELPFESVLVISGEARRIDDARAAFREANVRLLTADNRGETERLLRENRVDVVFVSAQLLEQKLTGNLHRLREDAQGAMVLCCCEYAERERIMALAEQEGIDGVLVRPIFLSNIAGAIARIQNKGMEEAAEDSSVLNGLRFLCAEDNVLNAEILSAILDMNHASCTIYPDGKQLVDAFATVKAGEYDAILMDVQMPVMNGLDATRAIRHGENPLGKTIPIIAMTANAFSEDVQHCLDAGMDAHVAKPLDMGTLERTLKSVLGGKFSGGGTPVRQ